jgi:hypothetical protein
MTVCEMRTFQSIVAGTAMYGAAYLLFTTKYRERVIVELGLLL